MQFCINLDASQHCSHVSFKAFVRNNNLGLPKAFSKPDDCVNRQYNIDDTYNNDNHIKHL